LTGRGEGCAKRGQDSTQQAEGNTAKSHPKRLARAGKSAPNTKISPQNLTPPRLLGMVNRFRACPGPVAAEVLADAASRVDWMSSFTRRVWAGSKHRPATLRHLAIVPATPSSRFIGVQGWAMRDGTAKRSQLQLPVVLVSKHRGSKGRSATVDCCSSDLSFQAEARENLRARHVSVLTFSCACRTERQDVLPLRLLRF